MPDQLAEKGELRYDGIDLDGPADILRKAAGGTSLGDIDETSPNQPRST